MLDLKKILVTVDSAAGADRVLQLGRYLAVQHEAAIRVLHVAEDLAAAREFEREFDERLRPQLMPCRDIELVAVAQPRPAESILRMSRRDDIDMILMGKHGSRTTDRLLTYLGAYGQAIGSTAEFVVRTSQRPVFLASPRFVRGSEEVRRILVTIDFSSYTPAALRLGRELGSLFGAEVEYLHVKEGPDGVDADITAPPNGFSHSVFAVERGGPPDRVIIDHLKRTDADILAIHSHGNTGDRRTRIGHVAEKLIQSAPCSVLTIKSFGKSPVHPDASDMAIAARMRDRASVA